jgi:hypothetical protein
MGFFPDPGIRILPLVDVVIISAIDVERYRNSPFCVSPIILFFLRKGVSAKNVTLPPVYPLVSAGFRWSGASHVWSTVLCSGLFAGRTGVRMMG